MSGLQEQDPSDVRSVKAGDGMDEMECVCGEVLRGPKKAGELARQYAEHMKRDDHKPTPEQWYEAYKAIEKGRERAKKQQSA